ncbi:hypothetical protein TPSD3_05315 [Thioflexithrix psekupsensis]|uniref:Uncharacterized protein n=1 Tax=Thioflexithrix psekupsensis TaxID=1570016 RepID=A0A251X8A8_9GAMM|nr:hypothetical protein TPSD3_05315 [Thioflexithrix psekupsensis]
MGKAYAVWAFWLFNSGHYATQRIFRGRCGDLGLRWVFGVVTGDVGLNVVGFNDIFRGETKRGL